MWVISHVTYSSRSNRKRQIENSQVVTPLKVCSDYEKNTYYFVSVTCDRSVVFSGYSGFLHQ